MDIKIALRPPRFPLITDAGTALLCAKTLTELNRKLSGLTFPADAKLLVIDSTAEAFFLHLDTMLLVPSIAVRRRTKTELIELYNLKRSSAQPEYKTTSLGSKRVERVVADLLELICRIHEDRR